MLQLAADRQHLIEISQGGAWSVFFFPLFLVRCMIVLPVQLQFQLSFALKYSKGEKCVHFI